MESDHIIITNPLPRPKYAPHNKVKEVLICLALTIIIITLTIWLFGCEKKKETLNCDKRVTTHCQNVEGK